MSKKNLEDSLSRSSEPTAPGGEPRTSLPDDGSKGTFWECPLCNPRFRDAGKTNGQVILEQQAHFASGCKATSR